MGRMVGRAGLYAMPLHSWPPVGPHSCSCAGQLSLLATAYWPSTRHWAVT